MLYYISTFSATLEGSLFFHNLFKHFEVTYMYYLWVWVRLVFQIFPPLLLTGHDMFYASPILSSHPTAKYRYCSFRNKPSVFGFHSYNNGKKFNFIFMARKNCDFTLFSLYVTQGLNLAQIIVRIYCWLLINDIPAVCYTLTLASTENAS